MWMLVSAASGLLWAGVVHLLLPQAFSWLWVGAIASPAIGLLAGWAIRPFRGVDRTGAAVLSLVTLYCTAALFATAGGAGNAARGVGPVTSGTPVATAVLGTTLDALWGLTFSGMFAVLWPLSFANHYVIWWAQRRTATTTSRSRRPGLKGRSEER